MKKSLLYTCLVLLLVSACKREVSPVETTPTETDVTLSFSANFDGEDLVLFHEYLNVSEHAMMVEQLKMYMSDIRLVNGSGDEVPLSELEFFDFSTSDLSRIYTVPADTYTSLKLGIGVPPALNGTEDEYFDPAAYAPGHPLALANNMYWAWASGYRFMIYDGRVDVTPGDPGDVPVPYSIHMGRDTTYLALEFGLGGTPISNNLDLGFGLDVSRCIYNAQDTLHLDDPNENTYHGSQIPVAMRFRALLEEAVSVSVN